MADDLECLLDELCGPPETKVQEIDIFSPPASSKDQSSQKSSKLDGEFIGKPSKYSEYGQQIKEIMKSQSAGSKRKWTQDDEVSGGWCDLQAPSSNTQQHKGQLEKSAASFIEPNSRLAVVSAQIPLEDLNQKLSDKAIMKLSKITPSSVPNVKQGQNWVTFAVLARKLPPKESVKGRPFSVWYLTDLNDLERLETLFLFGAAHEAHWKLPEKTVVGLLNPDVKEDREKGQTRFTLSIDHPLKLLILGQSRDFAVCQSHTKSGESCTKIVNKAKSEFCVYHAMTLLKKGAKRPELAAYGSANFLQNAKRPKTEQSQLEMKRVASSITASAFGPCLQPNRAPIIDSGSHGTSASVGSGLPSASRIKSMLPSSGPGVMNVEKLEEKARRAKDSSTSAFLIPAASSAISADKIDTTSWGRHMLQTIQVKMNTESSIARSRREKLAAMIRSGQQSAPSKVDPNRPSLGSPPPVPQVVSKENKKQEKSSPVVLKETEDAKKILETSSRHSQAVDDAFNSRQDAYFRALEPKDRAEQQLSNTFKIKVKVIICKTCLYVAQSAADRCKKEHPAAIMGPVDTYRRFFSCRECSFRTTTFSRFPADPCHRCKSSRWKPAPVREMASWKPEKLSIGVEELPQFLDGGNDDEAGNGLDYGINA